MNIGCGLIPCTHGNSVLFESVHVIIISSVNHGECMWMSEQFLLIYFAIINDFPALRGGKPSLTFFMDGFHQECIISEREYPTPILLCSSSCSRS